MAFTRNNLQTLKTWSEILSRSEEYYWTKWDMNLSMKILHEIEDVNKNIYLARKAKAKH